MLSESVYSLVYIYWACTVYEMLWRIQGWLNLSFIPKGKESPFNLISNILEATLMIKRSASGIWVTLQDYSLDGLGDPWARQILVELPVAELKLGVMEWVNQGKKVG